MPISLPLPPLIVSPADAIDGELYLLMHEDSAMVVLAARVGQETGYVVLKQQFETSLEAVPGWYYREGFRDSQLIKIDGVELELLGSVKGEIALPSASAEAGDILFGSAGNVYIYLPSGGRGTMAVNLTNGELSPPPRPRTTYRHWRLIKRQLAGEVIEIMRR